MRVTSEDMLETIPPPPAGRNTRRGGCPIARTACLPERAVRPDNVPGAAMKIVVSDEVHLSEFRSSDRRAVVQRVCRHAVEELSLAKITAHVFAHNLASARVLEKCGFQQEGLLRKHFLKDGAYLDARLFAWFS